MSEELHCKVCDYPTAHRCEHCEKPICVKHARGDSFVGWICRSCDIKLGN